MTKLPRDDGFATYPASDETRAAFARKAHEADAWLKAIVENSDDAILSKTLDGIIMTWNAGAERLFGYAAREAIGQPVTIIIPADRLHEEGHILRRLRAGARVTQFETVRRRKDGQLVNISLTVSPVTDDTGRILGASKIARDVTAATQAAARQDLIIREMNHRIKNLFALTTSLVALSARGTDSPQELARDLTARLRALARAHGLILTNFYDDIAAETGTTVSALLREVLAPYDDAAGSRISIDGDPIAVGHHALPTLSLLFHELATNAVKYGALASEGGRLNIHISLRGQCADILWREAGAPRREAAHPQSEGFGSRLERASVGGLRGTVERIWHAHGLDVHLTFPSQKLAH